MKKMISLLTVLALTFTISMGTTFAEKTTYTETELNTILTKAEVPQTILEGMDYDLKNFIVTNSGEDLKFADSTTQEYIRDQKTNSLVRSDQMKSLDNIPTSDLSLTLLHFVINYNGTNMDDVYNSFEWKKNPSISPDGIYKDNIAIAVPDGWEVQSGKYACATQTYDYTIANGWQWTAPDSSTCNNGQPVQYHMYGAAWEFNSTKVAVPGFKFKGTSKLTMKKKNSTAINRVVGAYNEAKSNIFGNYSVTIAFGPASVSFSPNSGSNSYQQIDLTW